MFAKNLCSVQACCLLVHLVFLLALCNEIQAKLAQSTSGDGIIKKIIFAAESVLTSRPRVSKIQLQLLLDSEKQGRTKLQNMVHELNQAKEQADTKRIQYYQDLHVMKKEQETMKQAQHLNNDLIAQLLAKCPSRHAAELPCVEK